MAYSWASIRSWSLPAGLRSDVIEHHRSVRFGRYILHPTQGLTCGNLEVRLTPKSLAVLRALADRSGQVVTKEELFRTVWPDTAVSDAALSSCILELRHALEDDARRPRYIQTVYRRGFRFLARCTTDFIDPDDLGLRVWLAGPAGPLVGRERELEQLSGALDRARDAARQVVFVTGEAGIGKTALIEGFIAGIDQRESWHICRAACTEHWGAGEAYQPLIEALAALCRQPGGEDVVSTLRRCGPAWLAQLPGVLMPAERLALRRRTAAATTERLLRELTQGLEAIAVQAPLLLYFEDLHWSDSATIDWIASFAGRPGRTAILLVAAYRHDEPNGMGSVHALAADLSVRKLCTIISLRPLNESAVTEYVMRRFPPQCEARASLEVLVRHVHQHTEGHPLFVVSVLDELIARGILLSRDARWTVSGDLEPQSFGIPADVGRAIQRRLDRLNETERQVLDVASVAGGVCSSAAVAAGAGLAIETVDATLGALARENAFLREHSAVEWPDGTVSTTFEFAHALERHVLLERLSPARRANTHQLIGLRLEAAYGPRVTEIAAELAEHFEQAGDRDRSVIYRQQAGDVDRLRSAHNGAQTHFRRALALLERLPPSAERDAREAVLRIALGGELIAAKGLSHIEVDASYGRALALYRHTDAAGHLFDVLWGLWVFYLSRGPLSTARELADRLFDLAQPSQEPARLLEAHHAIWSTALMLGDLSAAQRHTRQGMGVCGSTRNAALVVTYGCTLHDAHLENHHAATCAGVFSAWADALTGRAETAARGLDATIAHARDLAHPYTLAVTLAVAAAVLHVSRDAAGAGERASEAEAIAQEHGFGILYTWASVYKGRAVADLGDIERGFSLLRDGLAGSREANLTLFQPLQLALAAEAFLRNRRFEEAGTLIHEAFDISERRGERLCTAELHRLRAELRLSDSRDLEARRVAEEDLRTAIDISRAQGARLLTLRAAVSLARTLAGTRRSAEALLLLGDARDEVPEGRDLPDLVEAKALMDGGADTAAIHHWS
jgi:DNA-binding winged helix-turn-helix (wHTH) protein